jgi:hypothetical protein
VPAALEGAHSTVNDRHLGNVGEMDVRDNEWQSGPIWEENVWAKAVHRVAVEGWSPEQAVDAAIARIKQILSE